MTCAICDLDPDIVCPFCPEDEFLHALYVPGVCGDIKLLPLPLDPFRRGEAIQRMLSCACEEMRWFGWDDGKRYVLVAYFNPESEEDNSYLEGVGGDAIVVLMDRESGEDVSIPVD
jgi:hypothetical protein